MNVPDISLDAIKGYRLTRLGKRQRGLSVQKSHDPRGRAVYWIGLMGKPVASNTKLIFRQLSKVMLALRLCKLT
jgi:5'-nucleotidase